NIRFLSRLFTLILLPFSNYFPKTTRHNLRARVLNPPYTWEASTLQTVLLSASRQFVPKPGVVLQLRLQSPNQGRKCSCEIEQESSLHCSLSVCGRSREAVTPSKIRLPWLLDSKTGSACEPPGWRGPPFRPRRRPARRGASLCGPPGRPSAREPTRRRRPLGPLRRRPRRPRRRSPPVRAPWWPLARRRARS